MRGRLPLWLALAATLLAAGEAAARPGGGQSYSGGGHGGGGGGHGGGGNFGLIFFALRLWFDFVFAYPLVGIPLSIVILVALIRHALTHVAAAPLGGLAAVLGTSIKDADRTHWTSAAAPQVPLSRAQDLDSIRELDPEFSVVLFEDFVYALYAKAHQARANRQDLEALSPYLSGGVREQLAQRPPVGVPVTAVVIGAMRVVRLFLPPRAPSAAPGSPAGGAVPPSATMPPHYVVVLEFESNLTVGAAGKESTVYARERWRLLRDAAARSRPPEEIGSFHCPNCGAPFSAGAGDRCAYCGEVVSAGRFDWGVAGIEVLAQEARPPALTTTAPEDGTALPTVFHAELAHRRAEMLAADPQSGEEAVVARLRLIYGELNTAWTALDLAPIRPFVSDGLFDYLEYWIGAYRRQGLRNELKGMRMTRWALAKVIRDRHFDSLTFRIWATGRDYTVRQAGGEVVAGNPGADRDYSEYWTLIRGAAVRGAPRTDKSCPNCGAALEVNMAGRCAHCDAKITRGDFDWVLSKIEQDESYAA